MAFASCLLHLTRLMCRLFTRQDSFISFCCHQKCWIKCFSSPLFLAPTLSAQLLNQSLSVAETSRFARGKLRRRLSFASLLAAFTISVSLENCLSVPQLNWSVACKSEASLCFPHGPGLACP